jgi:hypothetical protein
MKDRVAIASKYYLKHREEISQKYKEKRAQRTPEQIEAQRLWHRNYNKEHRECRNAQARLRRRLISEQKQKQKSENPRQFVPPTPKPTPKPPLWPPPPPELPPPPVVLVLRPDFLVSFS